MSLTKFNVFGCEPRKLRRVHEIEAHWLPFEVKKIVKGQILPFLIPEAVFTKSYSANRTFSIGTLSKASKSQRKNKTTNENPSTVVSLFISDAKFRN